MLDNLPVFCILPPDTAGCSAVARPGTGRQKKGREGERPLSLWGPGPGAGRESRRRLATGLHLACNGPATGLHQAWNRLASGLQQVYNRLETGLQQAYNRLASGLEQACIRLATTERQRYCPSAARLLLWGYHPVPLATQPVKHALPLLSTARPHPLTDQLIRSINYQLPQPPPAAARPRRSPWNHLANCRTSAGFG